MPTKRCLRDLDHEARGQEVLSGVNPIDTSWSAIKYNVWCAQCMCIYVCTTCYGYTVQVVRNCIEYLSIPAIYLFIVLKCIWYSEHEDVLHHNTLLPSSLPPPHTWIHTPLLHSPTVQGHYSCPVQWRVLCMQVWLLDLPLWAVWPDGGGEDSCCRWRPRHYFSMEEQVVLWW